MSNWYLSLQETANKVARIPFAKTLLKPIYYPLKRIVEKRGDPSFRKNGLNVLDLFDKTLTDNGYDYSLAFGTMLGAVREKGFIKHDLDIDVMMWAEDFSDRLQQCLFNAGFTLKHYFVVENGTLGREETYSKDGVSIDIFYIYPAVKELPYCCDFLSYGSKAPTLRTSMKQYGRVLARRIEIPIEKSFKRVPFENLMLPVTVNATEYLKHRYGSDYMTPNPHWTIESHDDFIIKWPEAKAIYVVVPPKN